ncbi:PREDICTED: F-box protein At5g07610-like [Fragaria vesca subsp. vesca]
MVLGTRSHRKLWSKCRASSSSTSAETIASTDELLTEILARMPLRSLFRFKCISTHWHSFMSDPNLCHLHTLLNPINSPIYGIFADDFSFLPFPLSHDRSSPASSSRNLYDGIWIIHSCNGLLLCRGNDGTRTGTSPYFVVNPTTNKLSTLRVPPEVTYIIGCHMVFDPSKSPYYKVLCFHTTPKSKEVFQIQIYSSQTRSWRLLNSSFGKELSSYHDGVYCNGAIHWINKVADMTYYHIDEERFGFVEGPPQLLQRDWDANMCRYFKESSCGGHLHLIDIYKPCLTKFQVFEMPRDYSGWFVKYDVELDPECFCGRIRNLDYTTIDILLLDENEEEGSSSMLLHLPGEVLTCNLKSKSFKYFDLPHPSVLVGKYDYPYRETLACV